MLQYVLGDRRFVDGGVLVRPEMLESIIGDALPLSLAYHPRQTVHFCCFHKDAEKHQRSNFDSFVKRRSGVNQLLFGEGAMIFRLLAARSLVVKRVHDPSPATQWYSVI